MYLKQADKLNTKELKIVFKKMWENLDCLQRNCVGTVSSEVDAEVRKMKQAYTTIRDLLGI